MMFSTSADATISAHGESGLIQCIENWLGPVNPPSPHGIGDDCALIIDPASRPSLLTTDSLSLGRHFHLWTPPEKAGAKLIKRNLSDIAAMGGQPGPAVLALLCGPDLCTDWLKAFFDGIRNTCLAYELPLVGGDITQTDNGQFSAVLTLTGQAEKPLLRKTAAAGDALFVTGSLGGSILGKHLDFIPRIKEGQWLAGRSDCSALIDLTDGLAKDLPAIIPEGSVAALQLDRIPLSQAARKLSEETGKIALEHACTDGEDYELLFAVNQKTAVNDFAEDWLSRFPDLTLSCLGHIQLSDGKSGIIDALTGDALPWLDGYEHFSNQ